MNFMGHPAHQRAFPHCRMGSLQAVPPGARKRAWDRSGHPAVMDGRVWCLAGKSYSPDRRRFQAAALFCPI